MKLAVVIKGITDADMPAVADWLRPRWGHLRALWAPISGIHEGSIRNDE